MKKYLKSIGIVAIGIVIGFGVGFLVIPKDTGVGGGTGTLNQLSLFTSTAGQIKVASTTADLRVPSLTNCDTIDTNGTGVFACGTDDSGSGGGSGNIATSSTGVVSSLLFYTTAGASPELVDPVATTSMSAGTGLSFTGTLGALVGGIAGTLNAEVQTSDLHAAVTLAGTPNYLTLSAQEITLAKLDITDDTNLVGGTNITLSTNTLNVDDAFLVNDANDTTTGQLTALNFVASSGSATSTFAGGIAVETNGFLYDFTTNNVGIGTSSPYARLSVVGEVVGEYFTATSTTATSTFYGSINVGTTSPYTSSEVTIGNQQPGNHGLVVQGALGQTAHILMVRNNAGTELFAIEANGETEVHHTATSDNEIGLEIIIDAAGFGNVEAFRISYDTGALAAGEDTAVVLYSVDRFDSTGGGINIGECLATEGLTAVECIHVGVGIDVIHQTSGAFGDMSNGTSTDSGTETNRTVAFNSTGTDVTIFPDDNDDIIIGNTVKFGSIEFILDTVASGAGIKPTFEYSTGASTWATFNSIDGTEGMRHNGIVTIPVEDIGSAWVVGTNSEFQIRITRTQNNINTDAIEDMIQVAPVVDYRWDKDGDILVRNATTTSATTTAFAISGLLNISGDYIGDFAGTGLTVTGNALGVDASQGQITTVGALDAGSITSNFGTINNGASTIDTTGAVSFGNTVVNTGATLTVTDLTSAMLLTNGSGVLAEYAGTSCTNQFVRSLSALGAATCATVVDADVANDITIDSSNNVQAPKFIADLATATSTFAGSVGVGTTSPTEVQATFTVKGLIAKAVQLWSLAGTLILDITNDVVTALGAWDFGDATVEMPNGSAPVVNAIGEFALDTTDNQLLVATSTNAAFPAVIPLTQKLFAFTLASTSPEFVSGGVLPFPLHRDGFEITEIHCYVDSGTSVVFNVSDGSNDTESVTCDANNAADTSIDTNAIFTALEQAEGQIGTVTGAVNYLSVTVYGAFTRE